MEPFFHPSTKPQIDSVIAKPKGSLLLHGPASTGKATAALWIAKKLNCAGCPDSSCPSCKMLAAGNHPDVVVIRPDEKGKIGIERIHNLQHGLTFSRYNSSGQRVVIIENADTMTVPSQNSLLKTLEEPPANTLIILMATTPTDLLPTIVSRCQMLFFPALTTRQIEDHLTSVGTPKEASSEAAAVSRGAVGKALVYAKDPAELQRQLALWDSGCTFMAGDLFDRLAAVAGMDASQVKELVESMGFEIHRRLRSDPSLTLADSLLAVKRFHERTMANVSHRVAVEALALELPC